MSRFLDVNPDPACLHAAAQGDRAAQKALYDQLAGPVFTLVRRLVRDRAAAEDVFQEVVISTLRSLPDYRLEAPFGVWLRRIAINHCFMHLRSPWQRARCSLNQLLLARPERAEWAGPLVFPVEESAAELPLAELVDLDRALAGLSSTARAVLWLHDVEGLTHQEIGAAFNRTAAFSKSQLSRAQRALRATLSGSESAAHAAESSAPLASEQVW
jgi:RNA polymerase sigma factor (sigma-70 family)